MLDIVIVPVNLNKICVHILKQLLAFLISVSLTSSDFTSGGISSGFMWEERKFKTLNPSRILIVIFSPKNWQQI